MNKQQLVTDLLTVTPADKDWTNKSLMAMTKPHLEELWATIYDTDGDEPEGDDIEEVDGSRIKQKYRQKYAENAKKHERKAHTATGRNSLNNGDQLAIAMENLLPSEVCDVADDVFKQPKGTHATKYGHLNEGMRRMNAGNRIRGAVKRNEISVEDALNLIGETFLARPPLSE